MSSRVTISDLISGTAELNLSSEIHPISPAPRSRDFLLAHARRAVLSTPQQLRHLDQLSLVLPPLLLVAHPDVGYLARRTGRAARRAHIFPRGVESGGRSAAVRGGEEQTSNGGDEGGN